MTLSDDIKKEKENNKGKDLLKIDNGESVTFRPDVDENGKVIGKIFDREYQGKKSKAAMFPVTILPKGERMNFPLALTWADDLSDIVENDGFSTVTVTRKGEGTDTKYRFKGVSPNHESQDGT